MRTLRFPGGGTPDALSSGEYVVPIIGSHIATDKRRLALPLGQDIAYPRLSPNGEHFACQIHDGDKRDHVFEFVGLDANGEPRWIDHGHWPSVSPCIYKPDGTLIINGRDGQWGSQGLRYVTEAGDVVSADATYGSDVYRLSEFTPISGLIAIGQTHDNNRDDAAVYIDRVLRLIEPGPCRFIRVSHDGEQCAVAIWKPNNQKPSEGEAVLCWPTIADLRACELLTAVPPPPPPPKKDPETPVPAPNQIDAVRAAMRAHPEIDLLADDARGAILDIVCAGLGGEPWGRKAKNREGTDLNTDTLTYRFPDSTFEIIDVIAGQDPDPHNPDRGKFATWDTDGKRWKAGENGYWVPARSVSTSPTGPTMPTTPSGPGAALDREIAGLLTRLAAAETAIAQLKARPTPSAPVPTSIHGTRIALKTHDGHYLCAEGGGGGEVNATRSGAGPWETLTIEVQR